MMKGSKIPVLQDKVLKHELQTRYDESRLLQTLVRQYQKRYPAMQTVDGLLKLVEHELNGSAMKKHHDELEKDYGKWLGYKK